MTKPELIGPYTLLAPLGNHAHGDLWLASAGANGAKVAIKLARSNDVAGRERLLHECELTIELDHPNIVRVHECGAADGVTWITSAYIGAKRGALTLANFRQLLLALVHLHSHGIVHGDINMDNLLLDDMGDLRLSGFGYARRFGETAPPPGRSGHCLSPEQSRGQAVDARTDLFAAAAILFQVLTGKDPFEGNAMQMLQLMSQETQAAPSQVAPGLGTSFDEVVKHGLARDKNLRYGSAFEFLSAFDAACRRGLRVSA